MKIVLESEDSLLLVPTEGMLTIEAVSAEQPYSSFHMLASALATCTFAVLDSWASQAELVVSDLSVRIRWSFAEEPRRVGKFAVELVWPSLPEGRLGAAKRVAALCAVHATLTHSPEIAIEIANQSQTTGPTSL